MANSSLVQLWFCNLTHLDENKAVIDRLRPFLSKTELAKVVRYRQAKMQTKALYIRSLLRSVLSQYAPLSPSQWKFEYSLKGKPRLIAEQRMQTGIEFNLSHSGDYLLIGISISDNKSLCLGVDIERARPDTNIYPILTHYFTEQETNTLLALAENQQRKRFFDLWTLKESYIKATGLGLAESLKSFGFDLSVANVDSVTMHTLETNDASHMRSLKALKLYSGVILEFADEGGDCLTKQQRDQCEWQTSLGRLDDEYRFAVTLGNSDKPIQLDAISIQPEQLLPISN